MKTKGAKRAGRKRIVNIKRQPNGERSRAGRSDKVREVATKGRQRVYNISAEDSMRPESGCSVGRALLRLEVTGRQFQASIIASEIITTYLRVKGLPRPTPQAFDMFRVVGLSGSDTHPDKVKAAEADYMRLQKAMRATDHPYAAASSVIAQAVIEDHDMGNWPKHMTRYLKDTLDAISKEFPERIVENVKKT